MNFFFGRIILFDVRLSISILMISGVEMGSAVRAKPEVQTHLFTHKRRVSIFYSRLGMGLRHIVAYQREITVKRHVHLI